MYLAIEPILPPQFLTQKVPILVGCSNALVAVCNLSVTYYFPTWFQTVMLSSASTAGTLSICFSVYRVNLNVVYFQDFTYCQIVFASLVDPSLLGESSFPVLLRRLQLFIDG